MPSSQEVFKKPLKPLSVQPRFNFGSSSTSSAAVASSIASSSNKQASAPNGAKKTSIKGKEKAKEVEVIDLTEDDTPEPPLRSKAKLKATNDTSNELWVDLYPPQDRESLAIHKKKITDVAAWFDEAFSSNPKLTKWRRVLVLSGPAGSGKTALVNVLANEFGVEVLEWKSGGNWEVANDQGRESMIQNFMTFLSRAGMAPALDLVSDPTISSSSSSSSSKRTASSSKFSPRSGPRLILIEDLPNTSHYPTKLAFRSAISQYLVSPRVTCPVILIISEALSRPGIDSLESNGGGGSSFTSGSSSNENFDSRSVLGNEILSQPGLREIKFNPIAPTVMKKPLLIILDQVYSKGKSDRWKQGSERPGNEAVEMIIKASNGDLRSALMSLQFLASCGEGKKWGGGQDGEGVKKGKKRKSDGSTDGSAGREEVKKLLQFVTARESSLFIFHALGKVLYSKRWNVTVDDDKKDLDRPGILQRPSIPPPKLPRHLRDEHSRQPSKVDPDVLFAEAPIDSDLFLSYLHHNYPPFTSTIEQCCSIIDSYSETDALMRLESDDFLKRVPLTSQYSFSLAVRSTLFHLPSPVPKNKQVLRKSELWDQIKRSRENLAMLDIYSRKGFVGEELRSSQKVLIDFMPFIGMMKRNSLDQGEKTRARFLIEMTTFPPPPTSATQVLVRGEALEEKETVDEEAEDHANEEEEFDDLAQGDSALEGETGMEDEELFDADDDIVE